MIGAAELPRAARPFATFPAFLRGFGFAVAPEQAIAFMAATELLGPRGMADIRRAAHATLAPPPERHGEFEALFRAFFHGEAEAIPTGEANEGDTRVKDDRGAAAPPQEIAERSDSGQAASADEALAVRSFRAPRRDEVLIRLARRIPAQLPRRRGFRMAPAKRGETIDLRRTLRAGIRSGGDAPYLAQVRRRTRQRNILLLIDVSGSMKAHTQDYLRLAQAVTRAADRVETFTFGTRLTRISRAMHVRDPARALAQAAETVEDWDGGTRIGEALNAFLGVPRFAGYARGALVLVISDGLERGDHGEMMSAVRRLSRRAWRLSWLTPLAADRRFRPETAALKAILPWLDDLGNGGSIASLSDFILSLSNGEEPWSAARWRDQGGRPQ